LDTFANLQFSPDFFEGYARLRAAERRAVLKALMFLDNDERHPGLQVHPLHGELAGLWAVRASRNLRITFERMPDGKKAIANCSQHYDQ
jgi:Txe/YoeB family toxin of Txe-Axe toxin-antitoxin module